MLTSGISKAFEDVDTLREKENISYRRAAYVLAVGTVAEALELRGLYP